MSNKHFRTEGRCTIPDAVGDAEYQPGFHFPGGIIINGPPDDGCCQICRRDISELEPFGGAGDPLVGDFSGMKLVKKFREDFPGCVGSSWECRDCVCRPGSMWELDEEDKLGRALTDDERTTMRNEIESSMEQELAPSSKATEGNQSVCVTLTDSEIDEIRQHVGQHMPGNST